jgi:hypothetical protein
MATRCIMIAFLIVGMALSVPAMTDEERRDYREKLLRILPEVEAFNEWLDESDELPPDFDALPRINSLPDAFRFLDGRRVETPEDWKIRREEILSLFERYVSVSRSHPVSGPGGYAGISLHHDSA